jgi:hypothetical protein
MRLGFWLPVNDGQAGDVVETAVIREEWWLCWMQSAAIQKSLIFDALRDIGFREAVARMSP